MATAFLVLNSSGAAKKKPLLSTRRTRWFISQNPSYQLTPTESAKAQTSFCTQRHFWYRKQPKVGLSSSSVALGGHSSTGNVGCGVLWKRGCGGGCLDNEGYGQKTQIQSCSFWKQFDCLLGLSILSESSIPKNVEIVLCVFLGMKLINCHPCKLIFTAHITGLFGYHDLVFESRPIFHVPYPY